MSVTSRFNIAVTWRFNIFYCWTVTVQHSIMVNITWRRFGQSAKQLKVGHTTNQRKCRTVPVVLRRRIETAVTALYQDSYRLDIHSDRPTEISNIPFSFFFTHIRLTALCPGLPGSAGTGKVKPVWILQKQETVSGSGIGWAICKSAPRSRQITTPTTHYSVFYWPDALPAAQPTVSKHWRHIFFNEMKNELILITVVRRSCI